MWKGHENSLVRYGLAICSEWIKRGYKDTCFFKILSFYNMIDHQNDPEWLGNELLHSSHRSNLLRKDIIYYGRFNWAEPNNIPYFWPIAHM